MTFIKLAYPSYREGQPGWDQQGLNEGGVHLNRLTLEAMEKARYDMIMRSAFSTPVRNLDATHGHYFGLDENLQMT